MFIKKFAAAIFMLMISLSCSDQDKQNVKKDIDTMKTTTSQKIDTVKNKLLPNDTLFKSVTLKEVKVPENVGKNFHDNLDDVFDHYIAIKDELADNDSVDSRKHANEMLEVVTKASQDPESKIDKKWTLVGDKLMKYQKIIENSVTLNEQREWFSKLTASLTEAVQQYGIPGKTIYELQSSGAQGKGNKWLTDSKDTDDPYSGESDNTKSIVVVRGWDFD